MNEIGRGGVSLEQQMDPGRKRAFAARMRGHIAALSGSQASAPAPHRPAPPPADPDLDGPDPF